MNKHTVRRSAVPAATLAALAMLVLSAPSAVAGPAPVAKEMRPAVVVPAALYSDSFARQVFDLMNAKRAAAGVAPLKWNQSIADVSQDWSDHLGVVTRDPNFDFATIHRPVGTGKQIPRGATWYSEIIAFNFTPAAVVNWWMDSPSHKAAMLDSRVTDAGLGITVPTAGPYKGWRLVVSNLAGYPGSKPLPAASGSPATGAAPIQAKAAANPGLGSATAGVICGLVRGGCYQNYRNGVIMWSPATGARISMGGIRGQWAATGFENGGLGYPTTDEVGGLRAGGVYQNYEGGAIIWSPATGARISVGGIRAAWAASGFENGRLGYPVTNEVVGLRDGGVYQNYQGGAIIWSPATGARISIGGIRKTWASTGFENGRLGYPTTNEYSIGRGNVAQDYQGGRISWTHGTGASISYR
ncbi:MAG: CAP domain-containing protein [Actinomycetota bacterium]|nr:CAP domain-containing protein [Actinomycetota bacterium]